MRSILPKIPVPTMIVQATADIAVPAPVAHYLKANIPDARLREVAFAGHLPHMLAPAAITSLIAEFLDGAG